MGKLIGIATRTEKRAQMDVHSSAAVSFNQGVGSDFRGRNKGKRQVTVMSIESWEKVCEEIGKNIEWTTRRANLLVEGVELEKTEGGIISIGEAKLEITGELDPCNRMDEQFPGLTKVLTPFWRGGVTCRVISEGDINVGDEVKLITT
ncbi:MAG: MOSC domain-containing protein [Flavobacteriales bacterium]